MRALSTWIRKLHFDNTRGRDEERDLSWFASPLLLETPVDIEVKKAHGTQQAVGYKS